MIHYCPIFTDEYNQCFKSYHACLKCFIDLQSFKSYFTWPGVQLLGLYVTIHLTYYTFGDCKMTVPKCKCMCSKNVELCSKALLTLVTGTVGQVTPTSHSLQSHVYVESFMECISICGPYVIRKSNFRSLTY